MLYHLLILNYEYPPLGGGAGIITRHLAVEFAALGHKVTILTTWFEGLLEDEVDGNLRIIRLKARRKRLDRSNIREMYSYMRMSGKYAKQNFNRDDFDACIANFTLPGGFVARQLKNNIDLPYIIISHGHDIPWFYPKQMFLLHLAFYPLIKQVCTSSSRNIILTNEMKLIADSFIGRFKKAKNVVIPNGIHEKTFDFGEKPHDKLKILFVGRLVDQKSPLLFMKVMRDLKRDGIEYEAHVLGGGPMMNKMVQFKTDHQLDQVHLNGKIDHRQVIDLMMESHLLLAPSTHEAMSVTILEALSCGLYIVTTPISGNTDIVTHNGVLVNSKMAEDFTWEVIHFYNETFLAGNFERKAVPASLLQEYNWKVVAKRYLSVVDEITSEE